MNGKRLDQCFVQIRFIVACRSVIVVLDCFSIINHFVEGIIEVLDFLQNKWALLRRALRVQISNLTISGFHWDDQNQWSEITHTMEQQMNLWIIFWGGCVVSFDVLWSEWSHITDPDPHHPHGTLPPYVVIDPPMVFFFPTFGMDKSGKFRQLHWKAHLWISKIAKFESDLLKTN